MQFNAACLSAHASVLNYMWSRVRPHWKCPAFRAGVWKNAGAHANLDAVFSISMGASQSVNDVCVCVCVLGSIPSTRVRVHTQVQVL